MQALLSFRFPHYHQDVVLQLFVPLPEQRPHTIANFIFILTGQLPPPDMLSALSLSASNGMLPITMTDPDAARASGLAPFADTSVVRVERGSVVELGSSTTKTIFGSFLPDEPVQLPQGPAHGSLASTMLRRPAGTILCGNMGMSNTQASRYYILLAPAADPSRTAEQKEELATYAPLGMITSGLEDLMAATQATQVNARTLAPTKKVELVACHFEFDYRGLARKMQPSPHQGNTDTSAAATERKRIAGRTRGREEEDEEDASAHATRGGANLQLEAMARTAGGEGNEGSGFFQLNVHFPERSHRASPLSGNAKRRRAEAVALDADGQPVLRTTAVHLEGEMDMDGTGTGRSGRDFDFFGAQDAAFWNDIDLIKDQQTMRQHHRARRSGKSGVSASTSSSTSRKTASRAFGTGKKTTKAETSILGKTSHSKTKRASGKRY